MRIRQRFLSLIITMVMVLTMLPVSVIASAAAGQPTGPGFEPIVPFGPTQPAWVATPDPVIVPIGQNHFDFSVTFDTSATPYVLDSAPLALTWPAGAFATPNPFIAASAVQGVTPQVGQPQATMNPTPPTGMDQLGIAHQMIGGQTDVITLHLRLNILPGTLVNPGDSVQIDLLRGLFGTLPNYTTNMTVVRAGLATHQLQISSYPAGATPTGKSGTANAVALPNVPGTNTVAVGHPVELYAGTVANHDFLGWFRHDNLPSAAYQAIMNPAASTTHTFNMPNYAVNYVALWRQVTGTYTLQITNQPAGVTPTGQSGTANAVALNVPGNNTITVGHQVILDAGTVANHVFLGWFRHDNLPSNPATAPVATSPIRIFNMPAQNIHYVALWRPAPVAGVNNLQVSNNLTSVTPINQRVFVGGVRESDTIPVTIAVTENNVVSLDAGFVMGYEFLGWFRQGQEPTNLANAPLATSAMHVFSMPNQALNYVAVWRPVAAGSNTLLIGNAPEAVTPTGQTATANGVALALVSGTSTVTQGYQVILNAGTVPGHVFLGWFRAGQVPTIAARAAMAPATSATHTFTMPNENVHYVAVWRAVAGDPPIQQPSGGGGIPVTRQPARPQPEGAQLPDEQFHERFVFGYPDGTFRPGNSITRAEAAALMVRTFITEYSPTAPIPGNGGTFSDVAPGSWYYRYIAWAYAHDLIRGYPDGTFRPNQPITREEFAAISTRTVVTLFGDATFVDAANVSDWARNYVYTVYTRGWMHGNEHRQFLPTTNISRAETTALICRMLGRGDVTAESIADIANILTFSDVNNPSAWYFYYVIEASNSHWFIMSSNVELWTRVVN